jgi:hypothetical protein
MSAVIPSRIVPASGGSFSATSVRMGPSTPFDRRRSPRTFAAVLMDDLVHGAWILAGEMASAADGTSSRQATSVMVCLIIRVLFHPGFM